ncbi:MAG TPA: hypothetical protein VFT43_00230 [Candidatus Polarisedimenticolia bacterium]|nr:hypothetical protein [Candidatus Polarisedimenticolia bacterium]
MKVRVLFLFTLVVAIAFVGSIAYATTPKTAAAAPAAAPAAVTTAPASDESLAADPFLDASPVSSIVLEACSVCRTNIACTSDGQKCNPKGHSRCTCHVCNGILNCLNGG